MTGGGGGRKGLGNENDQTAAIALTAGPSSSTERDMDFVRQFAEEAAPLFQENYWTWSGVGVPTADDIEKFARILLEDAKDCGGSMGSGRIEATVESSGEQRLTISKWRDKPRLSVSSRAPCDGERET